jgi:Holliday junction resolvasome RuvABC DNA-binding subunit
MRNCCMDLLPKKNEKCCNYLISVSGIGPNTAMIMLSSMLPSEIAQAIIQEEVLKIQSIKGIGAKNGTTCHY